MKQQASHNALLDDKLYWRSFSLPLLRCLCLTEVDYALQKVHEDICGNHLGGISSAYKILRQRYCWPTLQKDTADIVKRCNQYQC